MLVWDPVSERNLPFGTLKTAALGELHLPSAISLNRAHGQIKPRKTTIRGPAVRKSHISDIHCPLTLAIVKVFDLLYLNGQSLLQRSLKFRKRNLKACLTEVKGRLEFSTEFEGKTAKDIRQRMEDIMNNRGEGLVIKHPDSEYVLNGRNKDWIKVRYLCVDSGCCLTAFVGQARVHGML